MNIDYTLVPNRLGQLLLGSTARGICSVKLGDKPEKLPDHLKSEFPQAKVVRNDEQSVGLTWVASGT